MLNNLVLIACAAKSMPYLKLCPDLWNKIRHEIARQEAIERECLREQINYISLCKIDAVKEHRREVRMRVEKIKSPAHHYLLGQNYGSSYLRESTHIELVPRKGLARHEAEYLAEHHGKKLAKYMGKLADRIFRGYVDTSHESDRILAQVRGIDSAVESIGCRRYDSMDWSTPDGELDV